MIFTIFHLRTVKYANVTQKKTGGARYKPLDLNAAYDLSAGPFGVLQAA